MALGTPGMARSLRRGALIVLILALAVLLVTGGALATRELLKDNFKGADGSPPDKAKWVVVEDDVQLDGETLLCEGSGMAKTKTYFHSMEFVVMVDVAIRDMTGEPVELGVVTENEKEDVKAFITVTYGDEHGWTVTYLTSDGEQVVHSDVNDSVVDDWYTVEIEVAEQEFHVNVTKMSDGTDVWRSGTLETLKFKLENFVELGTAGGSVAYDTFLIEDHQYHWQDHKETSVTVVMFIIFFCVLLLPFLVRKVEHNLEAFLFAMGAAAVTANYFLMDIPDKALEAALATGGSHGLPPVWTMPLVIAALEDPLMITAAVLIAGIVFHYGRDYFKRAMEKAVDRMSLKMFFAIIVITLGMVASLITAIISALLLVEVITVLRLDRKTETELTILTCFSIGLGAALTPVGEPLSTIVIVTKLEEEFLYLAKNIGEYIIPAIIAFGIIAYFYAGRSHVTRDTLSEDKVEEDIKEVFIRALKVYIFVMALVLLGTGFAPLIEWYIIKLHPMVLYWVNTSSAILDNATLAAAEITKGMSQEQINAALMSLLVSGGMLIPGNIPNIISAGKLHITSKEWAKFGAPIGAVWLAIFFVILFILKL